MEGQSLALIEAMQYKRASIVTHVGGVDELVLDNITGFIAEASTPKHLDLAMEKAWEKREESEQMGVAAYEHINRIHPVDAVGDFNKKLKDIISIN